MDEATHRAILAAWRIEQPRLLTRLSRLLRDVPLAEELTQDTLVAALERWPVTGVPERPGAWLMATAQHRALDVLRRVPMLTRSQEALAYAAGLDAVPDFDAHLDAHLDDDIGDELLRLVFTACHPSLPREGRVALALRMLCGLTTGEIARAYLVPEATIAQRIVRAKRTLAEAGATYETPHGADRDARMASVLEVIYLIFNEGYTAAAGADWQRPELCDEARRMGRVITRIAPGESEGFGLLALMELNASRTAARTDAQGDPVLLGDQDRRRWDPRQIRDGLAAIHRAQALGGGRRPYALQAAIVACHARAATAEDTDWTQIAAIYGVLAEVAPSPVVELNRAVAVGRAAGPEAGLVVLDAVRGAPALRGNHLVPAVRADLLLRAGRTAEARAALQEAAELAENVRERTMLLRRAAAIGGAGR